MILKMSEELTKKEAGRKKSLGELGELFGIKAFMLMTYFSSPFSAYKSAKG